MPKYADMTKAFSKHTLETFEAASASIPLRQLERVFDAVGIRLGQDPGGAAGTRRAQFRRYVASVDQRDVQQLQQLGAALGGLIDEVAVSKQEFLVRAATSDGFIFEGGRFRAAPSAASVEERMQALGLHVPAAAKVPPQLSTAFHWARVYGDRVFLSGHGAQERDGSLAGPFGHVGKDVTAEQATSSARLAMLSVLGSLKRAIGDLGLVAAWLRVDGFVLAAPGFDGTTNVIDGASELLIDVFGPEVAAHARTATGVAATPLSYPVVIAAEVAVRR